MAKKSEDDEGDIQRAMREHRLLDILLAPEEPRARARRGDNGPVDATFFAELLVNTHMHADDERAAQPALPPDGRGEPGDIGSGPDRESAIPASDRGVDD